MGCCRDGGSESEGGGPLCPEAGGGDEEGGRVGATAWLDEDEGLGVPLRSDAFLGLSWNSKGFFVV